MSKSMKPVLGGNESVRVCIAQVSPAYMDRDESTRRACKVISEAGASGARLVVFPEVWLSGYPYWTDGWDSPLGSWAGGRLRFFDEAVMVPSATTGAIGRAARQANVYVVMGCNEIDPRPAVNTIYNSLLFFDRDGTLMGRHRKLMPTFTERMFWGQGDASDLAVYETDIGRIGGLICGENLMTPLRAAMMSMGEDFHIAVFPGAFALHTGPRLEEWDNSGAFWGHTVTRAHAIEAGCFTLAACVHLDPDDVPDDFPFKGKMNIGYSKGGSQIVAPLGIPLVGPLEGAQMIYADCEAWMIKAIKAIVDTMGHYSRPDVVRVMLRGEDGWRLAGEPYASGHLPPISRAALQRAADTREISEERVEQIADEAKLLIGNRPG
jgi:nitrilase